jgi:hypothetical protein
MSGSIEQRAVRDTAHRQARTAYTSGLRCWACEAYVELPAELFCPEHKHIETEILVKDEERKQWRRKQLSK